MKINEIESSSNGLLKKIRALHQRSAREKTRDFLIEGPKAVQEAYNKGLTVGDVVVSQTFLTDDAALLAELDIAAVSVVDDQLFKELATTTTPPGILAIAQMPEYSAADLFKGNKPLIVIVDAIQDPGNLGTMVRTALAASVSGMILTKGTVDPYNPKVVRAAMGALFAMPMIWDLSYAEAVELCHQHNVRVIACEPTADKLVFEADLKGPVCFVFGNEGQGFNDADLSLADDLISIPMNPQSESLNVAISAGVILFTAVQQRIKARG